MNQSRKERFDDLLKSKSITQMDLFRKILRALHDDDPDRTAEKNKANFGKMISGERQFKEEYIPYLERYLETTYDYLVYGSNHFLNFENKGIRYAANSDKIEDYEELLVETNSHNAPLFNYDEFDKTILDYVVEYKAKNGLRYLINNGYVYLYSNGKDIMCGNGLSIAGSKKGIDVIRLILELDDSQLFDKFTSVWNRYEGSQNDLGVLKDEGTLIKIVQSKNVFKSLLKGKEVPLESFNLGLVDQENRQGMFCNPLLFDAANYLLLHEKDYPNQVKALLEFGLRHNSEVIRFIKETYPMETNFALDEKGYIKLGRTIVGSLFFYELAEQPDLKESTNQQLSQLNTWIDDFKFRSVAMNNGYSGSSVRLQDGQILKKTTENETEYRFFRNMEGKGLPFVPRLEKQKQGVDYFSYFDGRAESMVFEQSPKRIENITKALKALNDLSKSILGDDQVYVHDDLSPMNVVFRGDEVVGIIDWDSVKVGKEYEDLVYVMWTWLNIGHPARDNEHIFEGVKNILKTYAASAELKKGWADKMIEVMEARLAKTGKGQANYERVFTWVKESEIWVELYRDRIKEEIG